MGFEAGQLLLDQIQTAPGTAAQTRVLDTHLHVRGSTAR
jgi:DNA-binding LacI/PurR family transcriptional regulator